MAVDAFLFFTVGRSDGGMAGRHKQQGLPDAVSDPVGGDYRWLIFRDERLCGVLLFGRAAGLLNLRRFYLDCLVRNQTVGLKK
ncbi:hypothetical protein DAQ1742_01396 [Dickeya aquatica]|uniref:Uncharacterized protein n=1 Tax=Dickeya aquatica TaxID=1401087 RepID=A0A375A8M6_9GAMM|nr:hypothetical protein DAQ1742_01396 [Dickeya aquatica]